MVLSDSDPASPQLIPVAGSITVVSLSSSKLAFAGQAVGTTSPPQTVTLTNLGGTPLNFGGIGLGGTNPGDFSETNNCGTSIPGNSSCTITVTFQPTATGIRTAVVIINDDGGGSPQRVGLSGKGT